MGLFSSNKDEKKDQEARPSAPIPSDQGSQGLPSDAPPSYDQLQQIHTEQGQTPQYSSNQYGPNEYPPEKGSSTQFYPDEKNQATQQQPHGQGHYFQAPPPPQNQGGRWEAPGWGGEPQAPQAFQQGSSSMPPNAYVIKPRTANIATDDGKYTRPEYQQYKNRDQQRIAQGDYPMPREAFKHGAPLEPGHKAQGKSSGGFPGSSGASYYNAANR